MQAGAPLAKEALSTWAKAQQLKSALARVQAERAAFFKARTNRNEARAKLLKTYATAKLDGGETDEIVDNIKAFNERHPDDKIAMGALPVAVQKLREHRRSLRNGVPVGKRDKALYEAVLGSGDED